MLVNGIWMVKSLPYGRMEEAFNKFSTEAANNPNIYLKILCKIIGILLIKSILSRFVLYTLSGHMSRFQDPPDGYRISFISFFFLIFNYYDETLETKILDTQKQKKKWNEMKFNNWWWCKKWNCIWKQTKKLNVLCKCSLDVNCVRHFYYIYDWSFLFYGFESKIGRFFFCLFCFLVNFTWKTFY